MRAANGTRGKRVREAAAMAKAANAPRMQPLIMKGRAVTKPRLVETVPMAVR